MRARWGSSALPTTLSATGLFIMKRNATNLIITNGRGGKRMLQRETFLVRLFKFAAANHRFTVAHSNFMSRTTCSRWLERAQRGV